MQKKHSHVSLFTILLVLPFMVISCCKKEYPAYRAFIPVKELRLAPGADSYIPIKIEIPRKSHIYGNPKGPGTGKATEVFLKKNSHVSPGKARFLKAEKYTAPGEKEFVWAYHGETTLFLPITVKKSAPEKTISLQVTIDALLCDESTCLPRMDTLKLPLHIDKKAKGNGHDAATNSLFARATSSDERKFSTSPPAPKLDEKTARLYDETGFAPRHHEDADISGLLQAIIFGLIAGFILNFMPCVLPVVSLKVMSFVKNAGSEKRALIIQGLLFSAGILVSFTLLAVLAAFFGYSWGGLFQHEAFLIFMTALVFVLALSLFHVFTINIPSFAGKAAAEKGNPYSDAFTKGLLATLLATPCSGPFLGGTLAWALTQPPAVIFVIFISVGIGMALPYLLISFFPALLRFVPKPGNWMTTFEAVMGFLLFFTVIYLLAIMKAATVLPAVTFLAFLALGFWQFGKYGALFQPKKKRVLSLVFLLLIGTGGYGLSFHYFFRGEVKALTQPENFSVERLYENRKAGRVSMVKFTADWCPNCRMVESLALETEKVAAALEKNSVDFMTADITAKHPPAEELMRRLGSRSIPFLAIFPAGKDFKRPLCLRDIYSEEEVLSALKKAMAESGGEKTKMQFQFRVQ